MSVEWVHTWINEFGYDLQPRFLLFRQGSLAVASCLIASRTDWSKIIPIRRIFLNCAGEAERDSTYIEYNRLMCLPGYEASVVDALWVFLNSHNWDEFVLAGLESEPINSQLLASAVRMTVSEEPSWFVDLSAVRKSGLTYEGTLSANVRQQIRRSIRVYEELLGPVSVNLLEESAAVNSAFHDLAKQHQTSWNERGERGAFDSERFRAFHRRFIEQVSSKGGAHIVVVTAGEETIGHLYNLFLDGRVYFYQSGFSYTRDGRMKPGLVTHYLAIKNYLANRPDALEYDFLAGDSQYKRSLAKQKREMFWAVVQRPTLRVKGVEALRAVFRRYKASRFARA